MSHAMVAGGAAVRMTLVVSHELPEGSLPNEILTPSNVAQFLATHNWTCRADRQFDQVWVHEGDSGGRPTSVLLPREPSFVDYQKRLREALAVISQVCGIAPTQLAEQMASVHFEWAATEPQRAPVPDRVTLDRPVIDALPDIEMKLARRYEPERITVVGPVLELKRSDEIVEAREGAQGEIVVRADIGGRPRRITIPLAGEDYDWAVRAHLARLPFTAMGELGKQGNIWRLDEPIDVDRSFLEFRFRER
jgi:hypothetical protein